MYVNKFLCNEPELSEFKNGVSFCSVCNKNVYNSEVVDLSKLMETGKTICASVPIQKIAWIERSFLTLGLVAMSMVTPIDTFAQEQNHNPFEMSDSLLVTIKGYITDVNKMVIEEVKVVLLKDGVYISSCRTDDTGTYSLTLPKDTTSLYSIEVRAIDQGLMSMRLDGIPFDSLNHLTFKMEENKEDSRMLGEVGIIFKACERPRLNEPSGTTFKREDLKHMSR